MNVRTIRPRRAPRSVTRDALRGSALLVVGLLLALFVVIASPAAAKDREERPKESPLECELQYSLKGWSVFYKRAHGEGVIVCEDGQRAEVAIRVHGGGLTFGRSRIREGVGTFSGMFDIDEAFGSYAGVQAHAGAVRSTDATAVTKGEVSLALAGTGDGFDLGLAFSRFRILPR